jgi:hypothetical protein
MTAMDSERQVERIPVDVGDGVVIQVEVSQTGQEEVWGEALSFEHFTQGLEKIVRGLYAPIQAVRPTKASIQFGVELDIGKNGLIATLVQGSGTASVEIVLEWEQKDRKESKDASA